VTPPATTSASGKINLWDRLEIVIGDGPEAGRYITRLEDFGQGILVIGAPEFVGGTDLIRNGAPCRVIFTRDDAVYRFDSQIAVIARREKRIYLLRAPEAIQRVQRRQFVRLDLRRPLTVTVLGQPGSPSLPPHAVHRTVSLNLSGGGMLIEAPFELRPGARLLADVEFFPAIGIPTPVAAVVRRVDRPAAGGLAGIEFVRADYLAQVFTADELGRLPESVQQFSRSMQNKLVNYVFQEQVKLRQKGLL